MMMRSIDTDKRYLLTPVDVSKKPTTRLVPKSADKGITSVKSSKDIETRIIPLQQKLHTMDSYRYSG
jgi:hypothetical protein